VVEWWWENKDERETVNDRVARVWGLRLAIAVLRRATSGCSLDVEVELEDVLDDVNHAVTLDEAALIRVAAARRECVHDLLAPVV